MWRLSSSSIKAVDSGKARIKIRTSVGRVRRSYYGGCRRHGWSCFNVVEVFLRGYLKAGKGRGSRNRLARRKSGVGKIGIKRILMGSSRGTEVVCLCTKRGRFCFILLD